MKHSLYHARPRISIKFKMPQIKLFILRVIQVILKKVIDGKTGPRVGLPEEIVDTGNVRKKESEVKKIFNKEARSNTMTDRDKLMRIEEALHHLRDNYRKIKQNKSGAIAMYTNKDLGDMVTKDLEKLFVYMESLEVSD